MNYFLSTQKKGYPFLSSIFTYKKIFVFAFCSILFFPIGALHAQTDSLELTALDIVPLTSVIKVSNETACPMSLYCYELDSEEVLLNMGILQSGRSATIRPKAELGRLYTKNPETDEETASVYFFGGDYDLKISSGCLAILDADIVLTSDSTTFCIDLSANIGDPCEDGIQSTTDDRITDACTCEGTRSRPITSDCDTVKVLTFQDSIIVSNLNTELVNSVQVFTYNWQPIYTCAGNCEAMETIFAPNDSFRVKVTYYTRAWAQVCEVWTNISTINNFTTEEIANSRTNIKNRNLATKKGLSKWQVYPNPASTELVVKVAPNLMGTIRLTNLNGQVIREMSIASLQEATWTINISAMNKGLYLLQMQSEDGVLQTEKVVIGY